MRVAILGSGKSGVAAASLAMTQGHEVKIFDAKAAPEGFADESCEVVFSAGEKDAGEYRPELVVLSPGIEPESEFVEWFAKYGELVGEIEFAYRHYKGKIIAITGTNGKTTTTELVAIMMKAGGVSCEPCGNYGVPFSEVVLMDPQPESVALEVSSFQLETVSSFEPDVAVWLNFAPDHMDRYKSVEDYYRAKAHVFDRLGVDDLVVVRKGEKIPQVPCRVETFTSERDGADWTYNETSQDILKGGEVVIPLARTRLRGLHNAENVMAAAAACGELGVGMADINEALRHYAPPPHRCELIAILGDIEFLNDSKATNLHALEAALKSQTRPVILIAGGKEKGLDYSPLLPLLAEKVKGCVFFGQIREKLADLCKDLVPVQVAQGLDEAVRMSQEMAKAGMVVLFSPGTSSFDMFRGYEHRGDEFRKIVLSLK